MARAAIGWALGLVVGCSACVAPPQPATHEGHEDTSPELGVLRAALEADATVADAIASECSTGSIRGLGQQLIDEVQCERPGTFSRIDDIPNVILGDATFPWLQTAAADALRIVASKRDAAMTINSAYRTVAQQLMLYRWYRNGGRCGIALAALPGNSNHESALAVDVDEHSAWRSTFQTNDFAWLGRGDPVHFDYAGDGDTVDLRDFSVAAFQKLWNRNNPEDVIDEDGVYGPATETRILKAPAAGFDKGALCMAPPDPDAGATPLPSTSDAAAPPAAGDGGAAPASIDAPDCDESGCSMHASAGGASGWLLAVLVMLGRRRMSRRRVLAAFTPRPKSRVPCIGRRRVPTW